MNRIFKTIWSYTLNRPVVTDELHSAKHGKKSGKTATASALTAAAVVLAAGSPAASAETDDGWSYETGSSFHSISAQHAKTSYQSDGWLSISNNPTTDGDAVNAHNSSLRFVAEETVSFSSNTTNTKNDAGALNAWENTDVEVRGKRVDFLTTSGNGARSVVVGGKLNVVSNGTDEDDGIYINATAKNDFIRAINVKQGTAAFDSATDIEISTNGNQPESTASTTSNFNHFGIQVHRDASLVLNAADQLRMDFKIQHASDGNFSTGRSQN